MSPDSFQTYDGVTGLSIPTLSAYAVEFAELTPPPHLDTGYRTLHLGSDFGIVGDLLVLTIDFRRRDDESSSHR
jgi:hypothetical protein